MKSKDKYTPQPIQKVIRWYFKFEIGWGFDRYIFRSFDELIEWLIRFNFENFSDQKQIFLRFIGFYIDFQAFGEYK